MGTNISQLENAVKNDLTKEQSTKVLKKIQNEGYINTLNTLGFKAMNIPPIDQLMSSGKTSFSMNQSANFFNYVQDTNSNKYHIDDNIENCAVGNNLTRSSCRLSKVLTNLGGEDII